MTEDARSRDVLIVGSGPGGLSAAAAAGRAGLSATLFEREGIGGELVNRDELRGVPGFPDGVAGTALRSSLVAAVEQHDQVAAVLTEVTGIDPGDPHVVETRNGDYRGDVVVVAAGSRPAPLGVPGEEELRGMGVFTCAMCDGPLYAGERLAVAGDDDHAVIDALFLAGVAGHVTIYTPEPTLTAGPALREEAAAAEGLTVETGTEIVAVGGDDGVLEWVRLRDVDSGEEREEAVGGLFVHTGLLPNAAFLEGTLPLTDDGHVVVDATMETPVEGIFAVGDVREGSPHEVAAALGDGVTAMQAVKRALARGEPPTAE